MAEKPRVPPGTGTDRGGQTPQISQFREVKNGKKRVKAHRVKAYTMRRLMKIVDKKITPEDRRQDARNGRKAGDARHKEHREHREHRECHCKD